MSLLLMAARARANHIGSAPSVSFVDYVDSLSPVAHWRMDETSGTTLTDRIGSEVATLTGTYTLGAASLLNDDSDPSIEWSDGAAYTSAAQKWSLGTGDFSVFLITSWTNTALQTLLAIRDGTTTGVIGVVAVNRTGSQIEYNPWGSATNRLFTDANDVYNDGDPHAIGASFEATTNTMKLYVDGDLKATKVLTGTRPTGATMNVTFGANVGLNQNFAGFQDEVVLFDSKLSDADFAALASHVISP